MESTTEKHYPAFIEIPFAIYSKIPDQDGRGDHFVCIGAVFNDNVEKVFHPFDGEDQVKRDHWELAKAHMASTDLNFFTIRTHFK